MISKSDRRFCKCLEVLCQPVPELWAMVLNREIVLKKRTLYFVAEHCIDKISTFATALYSLKSERQALERANITLPAKPNTRRGKAGVEIQS